MSLWASKRIANNTTVKTALNVSGQSNGENPMLKYLLHVLIASLASASAFAASSCPTMPEFSDILRRTDGTIIYMTQSSALVYCVNHGQHLPSARELALLASKFGAEISETPQAGFNPISVKNMDGKIDTFYFSNAGLSTPPGDLAGGFWSSSLEPSRSNDAFIFDGYFRDIFSIGIQNNRAVICVKGF